MILNSPVKRLSEAFIFTFLAIVIIAALDYFTGAELSFSVFYLIPLSLFALFNKTTKRHLFIFSTIAAIAWFTVEINTKIYSSIFYPIWNASMRFSIFFSFGILLFNYKLRNKETYHANEALKQLNDEKNQFIGMAAHDLRNPVSGINSITHLLLAENESPLSEENTELITLIQQQSDNMLQLIKNILDVSKIESGTIQLNYSRQDYISFVNNEIRINNLLAKPKKITIALLNTEETIIADFDPSFISEVLNNILNNAVKYSGIGTRVSIEIKEMETEIYTEIKDEGPGISTEEQQKIFNYFQTASTMPTAGESATGLGLAIAKKIINTHGGKIGVKSELGSGATFYFSFPRYIEQPG